MDTVPYANVLDPRMYESSLSNHSRTAQLQRSWSTKVGSAHGAAAVARH